MRAIVNSIRVILFVFIALVCCPRAYAAEPSRPLSVFVSIEPQAYFVKRIGGERVDVEVLVTAGKNPAIYSPSPLQLGKLSKSEIYFRIGVPFEEALLDKIRSFATRLNIVDTREGIPLRQMEGGDRHHAAHGHVHGGEGKDPHVWLNPRYVKIQAETIFRTLAAVDPSGKRCYEKNYQAFVRELDLLDEKIREALAPVKGGTIFVFHPAFGYFADAYGLKQVAVEMEGKAPRGKELARFIKLARREKARVVFVQPQFDRHAANKIASAIKGAVVPLNPLAANYMENLQEMAVTVSRALSAP